MPPVSSPAARPLGLSTYFSDSPPSSAGRRRRKRRGCRGRQRLERLGDPRVFLVPALVERQLLAFERFGPGAPDRRIPARGELLLEHGGFQLVVRVVRPLPRQPVRRPPRVRGRPSSRGRTETRRRTARSIAADSSGIQLADGARQRLPHQQRARVVLHGGQRRRKQLDNGEPPAMRGLFAVRAHLAHDLRGADQHGSDDDCRRYEENQTGAVSTEGRCGESGRPGADVRSAPPAR